MNLPAKIQLSPDNTEIWLRLLTISIERRDPARALELALQGPQSPGFLLTCATMAKYTMTLANGGTRYQLHFLNRIETGIQS